MSVPSRRTVMAVPPAITVQWANGKAMARPGGTQERFTGHVGFISEIGRDSRFDDWMTARGVERLEVRHPRPSGPSEIKGYWNLGDTVRFFPLTEGPPAATVAACLRQIDATVAAGIGLHWRRGERSRMAVRGYLQVDGMVYLERPCQIAARSRLTDCLLAALVQHTRICETLDAIVDRERHPDPVGLFEVALLLGPGEEEEWGRTETATITPFVSVVPASGEMTRDDLVRYWRPAALMDAAARDWTRTQAWATEFSSPEDVVLDDSDEER